MDPTTQYTAGPQSISHANESSKSLDVDESTLRDSYTIFGSISRRSSSSTLTNGSRWLPGGRISGLILHAFGSSTVDLAVHIMIKRRLDNISSKMDIRSSADGSVWSDTDAKSTFIAYSDLVELSSGSYGEKIKIRAMFLRLTMLRSIIWTQQSWLNPGKFQQKFCEIWDELDALQPHQSGAEALKTIFDLRRTLVEKVAGELSSFVTQSWTDTVEKALAGTNIVAVLCHDLAHGIGGYSVQSALSCISFSDWGVSQLRQLDRESDDVLHAAERLLIDFDNTYSRGMAFRIFGRVAVSSEFMTSSSRPDRIGRILTGPSGTCRLLGGLEKEAYGFLPTPFGAPSLESTCDALSSACSAGFTRDIVQQGVCRIFVMLLDAFVHRDPIVQSYIEEEETDDRAIEAGQMAVMKLILKILEDTEGKETMKALEVTGQLWKFHNHCNRIFSDWSLRSLTRQVLQNLA